MKKVVHLPYNKTHIQVERLRKEAEDELLKREEILSWVKFIAIVFGFAFIATSLVIGIVLLIT